MIVILDGTFSIMRTSGVKFYVRKSNKNIFKSMVSGEGLFLETFEGTGKVWLAPTRDVLERHLFKKSVYSPYDQVE